MVRNEETGLQVVTALDNARRRLMRATFATFGVVLILLAAWSHFLGIPTPMEAAGASTQMSWSSISVAGLTFVLAAGAWWLADRHETEATRVAGNCRECGTRFEQDFCLRCGGTRVVSG